MGFRQRIRRFEFQWIQRGQHDEGLVELVSLAAYGNRLLLHCLKQGGLSLRGCAVDFVSKDHIRKDWSGLKVEMLFAGLTLTDDVGAENIRRHQIRRELDSRGLQMQRIAQGLDQLRLAQSRNAFEQDVAARKDGHQDIVDNVAVPDDNLGDLSADALEFALKGLQVLLIQLRDHRTGIIRKSIDKGNLSLGRSIGPPGQEGWREAPGWLLKTLFWNNHPVCAVFGR